MSSTTSLHRSRDGRMLGGVCAGLARGLGVDVTLVRLVAVVLGIVGIGVVAYVALVLLLPEDGGVRPLATRAMDGEDRPLAIGLALVLVVGLLAFDGPFGWLPGPGWPVLLLGAGGAALAFGLARRDARADAGAGVGDVPVPAAAGPASVGPDEAPTIPLATPAPAPAPAGRHAGVAAAAALGAALMAFGAAGGVLLLADVGVGWDVVLAAAVIAVGVMLLVAAPFGGARALIPLGLALASVAGVAAAADLELAGGVGERHHRPASIGALQDTYELSAGSLTVDLRDVDLPAGATHVDVRVGFGELVVHVPDGIPVQVDAHAAGGELRVLGEVSDGLDADQTVELRGRGPSTSTRLVLDADVGFGQIVVVRGDDAVEDARRSRARVGTISPGAWR